MVKNIYSVIKGSKQTKIETKIEKSEKEDPVFVISKVYRTKLG